MKHLVISCLAYWYMGFALAILVWGDRKELGSARLFIWLTASIIFVVVAFTSLEKVKEIIKNDKSH